MPFEIPQEIRERTTECEKGLSCLTNERKDLCKVKFCVDDRLFFIESAERLDCPYVRGFGGLQLCICPTRQEIHRRHRV